MIELSKYFRCFETFDHVILILAIWIKEREREEQITTDPHESIILVDLIKLYIWFLAGRLV